MHPTASVVIRCYNEEEYIGRLLSGIVEQTLAEEVEIIVVDSGSTDSTVSIASKFPTKIVSIDPQEFSFGRALNIGCAEASGEFIVAASAHTYPVYEDWLERLLVPFDDPQVALTYGRQRGNEVTRYSEHQVFAQWFPTESNYDQDHPFCNNANAAIRRALWKEMPYNEELTGLEDLDWAKRAIERGQKSPMSLTRRSFTCTMRRQVKSLIGIVERPPLSSVFALGSPSHFGTSVDFSRPTLPATATQRSTMECWAPPSERF